MPFGRPVLNGRPQIAAGQRTRLVTIQQLTESEGTSGFPVETWTTLRTEYMSRQDLRANEHFATNQTSAFAETQWHGVYSADMDPELVDVAKVRRFSVEGRIYDILSGSRLEPFKSGLEYTTIAKQG